ncbi:hypothetical protein V501_09616 [Pseudogymnoascus sp. VKM F-4519 (FW-2642)]|uniref:Uncharacterized protein n=1 Tax=Pseudogymnoascus verrucosus TaxID=342668 RepID=A0A2P2SWH5_9PEZI|nr:uncharacterized protein VE01_00921 [Pseudogymnoascus verrucosus]KFZ02253.1 hypothetical protein V501_09616 [Pseudogymnoascus sp. VKM F-4519 (FW-2642)]OBU01201.1 hypothetical protein VE01_00921 [Pseudogymnoascus verrucosus]
MASSKDIQHPARPLGQHRLSMSSALGSSLPARSSHPRHHSHSISAGSLVPTHRVTRRKSGSANAAAVAAAVREMGEATLSAPMPTASSRRHTTSRPGGSKFAGLATPPSSLPGHRLSLMAGRKAERDESAIDDEQNDEMDDEGDSFNKARMRRASEGQSSVKSDGKKNDLRCDKWEHTPEWSYTSKLLISKHQQVQLLEAASVLVAMNQDGPTPPPSAKDFNSDQDSASPAASGSSDPRDGLSSTDTTPPPQTEATYGQSYTGSSFAGHRKRYSSGNNFSRSYQSAPSNGLHVGSMSNGSAFGSFGQQSQSGRPLSSGISAGGLEDEAGLAAAVELLSCSFGTPRTGPVTLPPDVPPVPPLPARYLAQGFSGTTLTPNHQGSAPTSYIRGREQHDGDVKMEESEESVADDDDYDSRSRGRSDEDDDGVFGRMEE